MSARDDARAWLGAMEPVSIPAYARTLKHLRALLAEADMLAERGSRETRAKLAAADALREEARRLCRTARNTLERDMVFVDVARVEAALAAYEALP